MSKEVGILMQPEMIQATIEGRKTLTSRIISPRNSRCSTLLTGDGQSWKDFDFDDVVIDGKGSNYGYIKVAVPSDGTRHRIFCKMWPKDARTDFPEATLLYVKEPHFMYGKWVTTKEKNKHGGYKKRFYQDKHFTEIRYLDNPPAKIQDWRKSSPGWYTRSPLFMPKEAARIWSEIIYIRPQRVQDISPADACDEGVNYWNIDKDALEGGELVADFENYMWRDDETYEDYHFPSYANPVDSYYSLWEKINGKESLESNPWVWRIYFKVLSTTGKP